MQYTPLKKFSNTDILQINKFINADRSTIETINNEWQEIQKENLAIYIENCEREKNLHKEISEFLKTKGLIPFTYGRNGSIKNSRWLTLMLSELPKPPFSYGSIPKLDSNKFRQIDGISIHINDSDNILAQYDSIKKQLERAKEANIKRNKLLAASYKYISDNNLSFTGGPDQAIELANSKAGEAWLEKNYPDGTAIDIDDNYCECETYIMGEHRCSCGNRRIEANFDGDILSGFYITTEPY